ncbi:CYB3 [Auxenochlorella protothecoides x Auxenochlorella symbiontica]
MVAGDASNDGFAFPDLPKPKPLPARNPLLERSTVTDSSAGSLAAPSAVGVPASGAAGRPRKKLPFQIGCSPMDWLRLSRSKADLSGLKGGAPRRGITLEEVKQHRTRDNAWTAIRGKVYNMSAYMAFHPGGDKMLLAVAGKDGTAMFDKYHPWVNIDFLMSACVVGLLAPPTPGPAGVEWEDDAPAQEHKPDDL